MNQLGKRSTHANHHRAAPAAADVQALDAHVPRQQSERESASGSGDAATAPVRASRDLWEDEQDVLDGPSDAPRPNGTRNDDVTRSERRHDRDAPRDGADGAVKTGDSVRQYLQEIGRVPLLSHAEEIALARRMEDGAAAALELEDVRAPERTRRGWQRRTSDGQVARDAMIQGNLRLVVAIAKRHQHRGMALLDVIQEGNVGLMRAVDKFEYRLGFKFSTYATWWIKQAINRAIADQGRVIRLPVHVVEIRSRIRRLSGELSQRLARAPSHEEVAASMGPGWNAERVDETLRATESTQSLEAPVGQHDDAVFGDFIADQSVRSPESQTDRVMLAESIERALSTLGDREATVLRMRNGLLDGRERSLEEVGAHFGVTRERIRQIETKALRKLKYQQQRRRDLLDFLE